MKKILLSLFWIITIWLVNFWNCSTVPDWISSLSSNQINWLNTNAINHWTNVNWSVINLYDRWNETNWIDRNLCAILSWFTRSSDFQWRLSFLSSLSTQSNWQYYSTNQVSLLCASWWRRYFAMASTSANNKFTIWEFWIVSPDQLLYLINSRYDFIECDSYLSTCQSDLNSCNSDLNTCENDLINCGEWNTPSCESWDIQWSSLYINDIQHLWASVIDITIPEEISWDYVNENDEFILDVNWYNQDSEYIDNIIRLQNYKPTSEDFTELIWTLAPYSKILIFCVFIFIIWAWLKKPFKSKKL